MKNYLLCLLGLSLFIGGCCTAVPPRYSSSVANDIVVCVKQFQLPDRVDEYDGSINFQQKASKFIAGQFQNSKIAAVAIPSGANPVPAKYLIDGTITILNGGSFAARYFLGFGAGAAEFGVRASLIDLSTNQTVATFSDSRRCGVAQSEDRVLECACIELSEDIYKAFSQKIK